MSVDVWTRRLHRGFFFLPLLFCTKDPWLRKKKNETSTAGFSVCVCVFGIEFPSTTQNIGWRVGLNCLFHFCSYTHNFIFYLYSLQAHANATHINYACYSYAIAIFFPCHLFKLTVLLCGSYSVPPSFLMTLYGLWTSCWCV